MSSDFETDPTKRFSDRVTYYVQYRPKYPETIVDHLKANINLSSLSIIADVGSGTGFLSDIFLKNGNLVFGVEPNKEMRQVAETLLRAYPKFRSINGSAEATTLETESIDIVTAGQAFHWFEVDKARQEFLRVLKPGGWVLLIWNARQSDSTPFLRAYENLLHRYAVNYRQVYHRNVNDRVLSDFFGSYQVKTFANFQRFDFESLQGRLLSSSYAPLASHPNHIPMLVELRQIFNEHQTDGMVRIEYDTNLYYGQLE